jgi:hypothetical protein
MKCKREEAQMKRLLVLFALEFLLLGHSHAQQFPHIQPAMPGDFAIMAWDNAPSDSALLEGIKDAGMNIAGFCKAEDVDRTTTGTHRRQKKACAKMSELWHTVLGIILRYWESS